MASRKESEGMALLSMYDDDEEDMADVKHEDFIESNINLSALQQHHSIHSDFLISDSLETLSPSPLHPNSPKLHTSSTISPQQISMISHNHYQTRKSKLTIVDYGHDEAQMSPEPEEGEITPSSFRDFCSDTITKDFADDKFRVFSPEIQTTGSIFVEKMIMDTVDIAGVESGTEVSPELPAVIEEGSNVDYLAVFFPPPPKTKCSEAVQEKINRFLAYKRTLIRPGRVSISPCSILKGMSKVITTID